MDCPCGGPDGTTRVCRNGITTLLQKGSKKNDVVESLPSRIAQHTNAVHDVSYEAAMRDLEHWDTTEWHEEDTEERRDRSRSPQNNPTRGQPLRLQPNSQSAASTSQTSGAMVAGMHIQTLSSNHIREIMACLSYELRRRGER